METIDIVTDAVECRIPKRIPSLCLGANYDYLEQYYNEFGLKYDKYLQYRKDNIPIVYIILIEMGVDFSWAFIDGDVVWLDKYGEPGLMHGGRFLFLTRDSSYIPPPGKQKHPIPHGWWLAHGLDTSEDIHDYMKYKLYYSTRSMHRIRELINTCEKKYDLILSAGLIGPWENLHFGIGFKNIAKWWRKDKPLLKDISNYYAEYTFKGLENLMKITKPLFVMLGDDYGVNTGLQMSIEMWKELVKPTLRELVKIVHDAGSKFLLHSCGNIGILFPEFIEIGIDGIESLQPSINNLIDLKKTYGRKISFLGTIDDSNLLRNSSPDDVRNSVLNSIGELGPGGYIPGPTNFLLDQPPRNIMSMLDTIKHYTIKNK